MVLPTIPLHGDLENCELNNTYDVQLCVFAAIAILLGGIMCFWGYKLYKFILFATGFLIGFSLTYMLCSLYMTELSDSLKEYKDQVYLGMSAAAGLIFGLLAVCAFYIGLFILGATLGWFVGMAFLPLLHMHVVYLADHNWLAFAILIGCALLGGLFILCLQKVVIILSTSFIGAFCLTNGLDYYIENNVTLYFSIKVLHGSVDDTMVPKCWYTWVVFSFIPILFVVGMFLQFAITSRGKDHRRGYNVVPVLIPPPPEHESTMMEDMVSDNQPLL